MSTGAQDTGWYVAQLKPNSEQIAVRNLAQQGFSTFAPKHEETRRRNGTFRTMRRPVFPGYLFIAIDASAAPWRAVNSTRGITRLVRLGSAPAVVPPQVMAQLQARFDGSQSAESGDTLAPGDRVQVEKGPFSGFVAKIEALAADQRVWLLMDVLGRQSLVSAHREQLRQA